MTAMNPQLAKAIVGILSIDAWMTADEVSGLLVKNTPLRPSSLTLQVHLDSLEMVDLIKHKVCIRGVNCGRVSYRIVLRNADLAPAYVPAILEAERSRHLLGTDTVRFVRLVIAAYEASTHP